MICKVYSKKGEKRIRRAFYSCSQRLTCVTNSLSSIRQKQARIHIIKQARIHIISASSLTKYKRKNKEQRSLPSYFKKEHKLSSDISILEFTKKVK